MTHPTISKAAAKRTARVAAIRDFAEWLADNPAMPVPELSFHKHLNHVDGTDVENLDLVRRIAASIGAGTDEQLDDRTVLRVRVNEHVWYELFAWHKGGRGDLGELERLRAEVAELKAANASRPHVEGCLGKYGLPCKCPDDPTGLSYSREADDPTPVSPARVPLHTGGVVDGGALVEDEAIG